MCTEGMNAGVRQDVLFFCKEPRRHVAGPIQHRDIVVDERYSRGQVVRSDHNLCNRALRACTYALEHHPRECCGQYRGHDKCEHDSFRVRKITSTKLRCRRKIKPPPRSLHRMVLASSPMTEHSILDVVAARRLNDSRLVAPYCEECGPPRYPRSCVRWREPHLPLKLQELTSPPACFPPTPPSPPSASYLRRPWLLRKRRGKRNHHPPP